VARITHVPIAPLYTARFAASMLAKKRTGKIIRTYHLQSYNKKNMNRIRWFVIGLHLYVFPPEPEVGDIEALHNWIPQKKGIIETLKFRFHTGIWSYTAGNINYQY
jgi:hypothetical protein